MLSQLHTGELLTDDVVAQILSQDHAGFGVWFGDPFHDKESEQFVARYIERAPLSLDKLSIQDDVVTYTTTDGTAIEFEAVGFLTRYYGRYSCGHRSERGKLTPPPDNATERDYRREFSKSCWAACIQRRYES